MAQTRNRNQNKNVQENQEAVRPSESQEQERENPSLNDSETNESSVNDLLARLNKFALEGDTSEDQALERVLGFAEAFMASSKDVESGSERDSELIALPSDGSVFEFENDLVSIGVFQLPNQVSYMQLKSAAGFGSWHPSTIEQEATTMAKEAVAALFARIEDWPVFSPDARMGVIVELLG